MTPREAAGRAARIAAYGSALAHTPADYTTLEAIRAMTREVTKQRKGKPGAAPDEALGPIFEMEDGK